MLTTKVIRNPGPENRISESNRLPSADSDHSLLAQFSGKTSWKKLSTNYLINIHR